MRVGFVQMDSQLMDIEGNVDRALGLLERVDADLMVLPELFNTGYNFSKRSQVEKVAERSPEGFTTQKLLEFSKAKRVMIVAGIAERKGGSIYNSAIVLNQKYLGTYRKVHLFWNEKKFFKPGREFKVYGDVGVMVCFDWYFPESMRTLMLRGARIVAHPSNLVLSHCPDSMRTRCLENRAFAVTADRIGRERGLKYIGRSQIVTPKGRVLYRASSNREEVIVREVDLNEASNKKVTELNDIIRDRQPSAYER